MGIYIVRTHLMVFVNKNFFLLACLDGSVWHPTLDLSTGVDLGVMKSEPHVGLCTGHVDR